MKTMVFNYPSKGSTELKERVLIPLAEASENHFGIDITELDAEDTARFVQTLELMKDKHAAEVANLMEMFDLKHRFRAFNPSKMTNLVIENL